MEEKEQQRQEQVELLRKNISLLQTQLQVEKQSMKPAGTVVWSLRLMAALGVGFVLGNF
ncbi:MAG TPA: hypothetical protein VFM60_02260 [Salinimicrobium sp.]|nr:hypothetical protein [Salinimicrobium sp.]